MADNYNGVQSTPGVRHALLAMYWLIVIYALWNVLVGWVTVFVSYGQFYSELLPLLLLVTTLTAIVGLHLTERTNKKAVEIIATLFFMGCLLTFAIAIVIRDLFENHLDQLQSLLLPIIIAVPSYFRLVAIFPPIRRWHR
jgi:uncharacterized protein YoaH (UPF0181 family)